jgi:eukaryotic-like serine/threonine-protein kinase
MAPRLEPNARIAGKLRLIERLATGGMGEVWRARNESTGADVAVKVLRGGVSADEAQAAKRFRNEARLSATLSHRSIVKVFDLVEDPSWGTLLVMELLRGETLQAHVLRKGPRPAREAVAILTPILGALAHAHERGIVHRDITPANIFLAVDPDGHVTPKLLDFGIAKLASGATADGPLHDVQTLDGSVLGTPRYMAPERIRGEEGVDGRADIFSAAVVMYEVLTGTCPFAAASPTGSLAAVLEQQVDPDPRIEPRAWVEIRRALSKRPYERHGTAKELAAALRATLGDGDGAAEAALHVTLPPPGSPEPGRSESVRPEYGPTGGQGVVVQPRRRRSSAVWVLAGILVGALVGLVGFGLSTLNRPPGATALPQSESVTARGTTGVPAPGLSVAPALVVAPVAPAPVEPAAPPAPTSVGVASTTASVAPSPPRFAPVVPPRARPVATTPGF